MMKFGLFILLGFSAVGALNASPAACSTGTAQTYTTTVDASGGCTESNLLFNQFSYTTSASGTALSLPASAVVISPLLNGGGTGFGFSLTGPFAAASNGAADGIFDYVVSTVDSSATLTGISLTFNGTSTGDGIAGVSENYCVNGSTVPPTSCGTGLKNISVQSSNGTSNLSDSASFGGATSVSVSKDIQVNGGTNGTATISNATNQFQTGGSGPSSVPEPATLSLVGGAMLLVGAFRYRRGKDQN
jgi:hypothetical protein